MGKQKSHTDVQTVILEEMDGFSPKKESLMFFLLRR